MSDATIAASTPAAIQSLLATSTKLWVDSVDPDLVAENFQWGATGATSNPVIIADLLKTGRFDSWILELIRAGQSDDVIAWEIADRLVRQAQEVFQPVWERTNGNDGYVSFELDPLLEDTQINLPHDERVKKYIALGEKWSAGHTNRLIKVPATAAGIESLEELAARGINLNVTLLFTPRQYQASRDAVWRGVQRFGDSSRYKSVYSIFVSRVDVFTETHAPQLSESAQGHVGLINAKQIWADNQQFWADKGMALEQEMVFASTGTKKPSDPVSKYIGALAGSDIQTNPPTTNTAVAEEGATFDRQIDVLPGAEVLAEIAEQVDFVKMESVLMKEGTYKFAQP
ncbi:MAG: transaldolase, partial [Pirellulaceae bacterium]